MFKNAFAKYARAVSDEAERRWLYKKYVAKTVAFMVLFALLFAFIVAASVLDERLEEDWALAVTIVLFLAWVVSGIAALCLGISFRSAYKAIITRPAIQGEMPEVTAYRQKAVQDKRSNFKRLWWAWLVFGVCAVAFIVCIVMEVIKNPNDDELGSWGNAAVVVALVSIFAILLVFIICVILKLMSGRTFEQQTANEAEVIDRAQGRKVKYNILSDVNAREEKMYEYLFPNTELRAEANRERKRRSKILAVGGIIIAVIAVAAAALLINSEEIFGTDIFGYMMPVIFTVVFGGMLTLSFATGGRLKAIEKRQKSELETNSAYAKNLEWYRVYESYYKYMSKIYLVFVAVGIVLGWALAVPFPDSWWSYLSLVPMGVGLCFNNIFIKNVRKKSLAIEREIDEQRQSGGQLPLGEGGEE